METAEEFRHFAEECRDIANSMQDIESKATWNGLADRWMRCANLEDKHTARPYRPHLKSELRVAGLPRHHFSGRQSA
jgi:hypothetical protein